MLCVVVFVLGLLQGAHSAVNSSPFTTKEVTCTPQGFKPNFVYDDDLANNNKIISLTLLLGAAGVTETGANAAPAYCQGSTPTDGNPISQTAAITITSTHLDGTKYTNANNGGLGEGFIPFQQATNGGTGTDATRCGGVLQHFTDTEVTPNVDKIKYEVNAKVIVRRKFRSKVIRTTSYQFVIRCALTREVGPLLSTATQNGFTVAGALVDETWGTAADGQARNTITYGSSLKLYTDQSYGTAATSHLQIDNNAKVYLRVEQDADQDLFKFFVDECYSTVGNNPAPSDATHKDVFFTGKCRADSTVTGTAESATKYKIEMNSFYYSGQESTNVFFHCKLIICLADTASNDATCSYPADCSSSAPIDEDTKRRRRRSTEESGFIGSKMITSSQSVLVNQAQVFAPSCGNGFIYDRVLGGCSNENLVEINGIYLGAAAWDPAYANITSDAFKSMAAAREYQLWVLLQVTRRTEYIHGVKIIRARQGSVILDVVIKYAASVSAEEAFFQLEQALQTKPSVTRVMNLLQIREGKTIELVPIVVAGEKSDTEKLILIVVVVVLFVIVFIAGVTLFKVRQVRQQSASTTTSSFDNKGVDA